MTIKRACREGEEGDNFYVIQSGQFQVTKADGDKEKLLFTYHGEGAFGELALMYNCPRAATVVVCDISLRCISFPYILLPSHAAADAANIVLSMYKAVCMY
jgi:CRP-like cAMP-binding protein